MINRIVESVTGQLEKDSEEKKKSGPGIVRGAIRTAIGAKIAQAAGAFDALRGSGVGERRKNPERGSRRYGRIERAIRRRRGTLDKPNEPLFVTGKQFKKSMKKASKGEKQAMARDYDATTPYHKRVNRKK